MSPTLHYTHKINHFAHKPINFGTITEAEAKAEQATLFCYRYRSEACGESVTLYWSVDQTNHTIVRARFESYGSLAARAIYDMLCMILRTKQIERLSTTIDYQALERFARDNPAHPALPDQDRYLITYAIEAVQSAANAYLGNSNDATKIVCQCHCVDEATIVRAIRRHKIADVDEVGDYTQAGRGCRSCIDRYSGLEDRDLTLKELIAREQEAMANEAKESGVDNDTPFEALELPQKIAYVNRIVDEHIRHFLVMDGGDMEILDIKENGPNIDIYIRYLGACSGCASSSTGTLFAIENILKEKLGPNVRVLPL